VTRGSLWAELEEPLDELEFEGGFELGEPDCELGAPDGELELEEVGVPDLELEAPDAPVDLELEAPDALVDLELEAPDALADLELEAPDALADFVLEALDPLVDDPGVPDAAELEEDAGLAGVPSFTAIRSGPVTPGPKYFAVRS
jgi:hypothetical protein